MDTGLIVLTTLKILGAILFFALAAAFQAGKVFSGWFRLFLVLQGVAVLNYSRNIPYILGMRADHPVGFALGTLPFLLLIPPLYLAVDAAVSTGERSNRRRRIIPAFLAGVCLAVVLATAVTGRASLLPGPGAHPAIRWIWNAWHITWVAAGGIHLFRRGAVTETTCTEKRTLAALVGYAGFTIIASAILEILSYRLDFLVTPALMILTAYAALGILIASAPRLIRQSRERYSGSDLDAEAAGALAERAVAIMKNEELWRQGDLSLDRLASECAASSRDLSQAINQHLGSGFPAWVNTFRLEYAEQLLVSGSRKISDIAFDSGFNSLSSFNAAFKSKHGTNPGDWRRTNRGF